MPITFDTAPALNEARLKELLARAHGVDTVRLRVAVPEERGYATAKALGIDPLNAPAGHAYLFEAPGLALHNAGLQVQARLIADHAPSMVVTLRRAVPHELPAAVVLSKRFQLDVDAMPGSYVCSASLKGAAEDELLGAALAGRRSPRKALTRQQRTFFADHAPAGIELDDLRAFGPIDLLRRKLVPEGFDRRLIIEVWSYPDGSRVTQLAVRCARPRVLATLAELRSFLAERGVGLSAVQHATTRAALEHFANL